MEIAIPNKRQYLFGAMITMKLTIEITKRILIYQDYPFIITNSPLIGENTLTEAHVTCGPLTQNRLYMTRNTIKDILCHID